MPSGKQKVVVIGWDGATYDIIDPMIKAGKLPHLAALIGGGTRAGLKSTVMPNSFPAWASCTTGVNPGKHGVFWSLIRDQGKAFPLRLMNSYDIKAKTVWRILGERSFDVCVVNVPTEYPPTEVNGILVCGALTPDSSSDFTYPKPLKEEILEEIPGYRCEIDYAHLSLEKLADQILNSIENRKKLILYLMENKRWDLFFSVFTETDLGQHKFWAGIDPLHPDHSRFKEQHKTLVYQIYELLDEALGEILKAIPDEANVFVVSDHGFGPFYQSFSLAKWLIREEYLTLEGSRLSGFGKNLLEKGHLADGARKARDFLNDVLRNLSGRTSVRAMRDKDVLSGERMMKKIDWNRTKAYSTPDYGIRINLKGREPYGIVRPGPEEESIRRDIIDGLRRLTYSNGEPVFEEVASKEEVFTGPFVENAPDIIVPISYSKAPPVPEPWEFTMTHPTLKGTHTPVGILVANGPGIKESYETEQAKIIDVAPTILHIFQEPLTTDMDGEVLVDIFHKKFMESRPIVRKGSSLESGIGEGTSSEENGGKVAERLRALGYID